MTDLVGQCLMRVSTERSPKQDLRYERQASSSSYLVIRFIHEREYCLLVSDYTTVSATQPKKLSGLHKAELRMIGGGHAQPC